MTDTKGEAIRQSEGRMQVPDHPVIRHLAGVGTGPRRGGGEGVRR